MDRRDFLMTTGMLGVAGVGTALAAKAYLLPYIKNKANEIIDKRVNEELARRELERTKIADRIYNELPNHVHIAEYVTNSILEKVVDKIKEEERIVRKIKGCGIILGGHYVSSGHISKAVNMTNNKTGIEEYKLDTGEKVKITQENKKVSIGNKKLEEIFFINDSFKDFVVYKLPDSLKLPEFPCKPSLDISLGEEVYLIGNPKLTGFNIRPGVITDLDGVTIRFPNLESGGYREFTNKNVFGTNIAVEPGDSGCPLVNSKFKLKGIVQFSAFDKFGYIEKISSLLEYIPKQENSPGNGLS